MHVRQATVSKLESGEPTTQLCIDTYSLLSAIGRDCVGALQFLPEGMAPATAGAIDGRAVDDKEIAAIVGNLARNPLGIGPDQEFRISLAGAQEKTALLYWKDKWYAPHGTRASKVCPQGFHVEHHTVLPDLELQLDRSEAYPASAWLQAGTIGVLPQRAATPIRTRR
jgi:hypothetical protein